MHLTRGWIGLGTDLGSEPAGRAYFLILDPNPTSSEDLESISPRTYQSMAWTAVHDT